jgi:hypothetical protein
VSIPEQFLKHFIYTNTDKITVELSGKEFFDLFEKWRGENGIKYDTTPQKLGVNISYLNLNGISKGNHTRNGETKIYNIPQIITSLNPQTKTKGVCDINIENIGI